MTSPYSNVHDYQMWRRAVSRVSVHQLNPVVHPKFSIQPNTLIGTAGSCFAQHISRRMTEIGFNFFVPENGNDLSTTDRRARQFGVFSARYGNIYTVRQLLQLYEEVFEDRRPVETAWFREADKRWVDCLRPQIEPAGFDSVEAVITDRMSHLRDVRRVFTESALFVFTLGLTEAWRSKEDGTVFPLAPGVVAGAYDKDRYEFVNFSASEVSADLKLFLAKIQAVNPGVKVLLTVSPVPLIATFEDKHVITSTTYSKSVLRVAAEEAYSEFDWCDYFPSYEIITNSATGGLYFEEDDREVNALGVAHAMRCFVENYVEGQKRIRESLTLPLDFSANSSDNEVICDEEAIDAVRV